MDIQLFNLLLLLGQISSALSNIGDHRGPWCLRSYPLLINPLTKINITCNRFANQDSLIYQDALGGALVQYSRVVPGGILVFFPSYSLLDKMKGRWESTGLLDTLSEVKGVHFEPRGSGEIEGVLAAYHADIRAARSTCVEVPDHQQRSHRLQGHTGALMMAVARGKVSEGIDFSDDAARMCVIVGIAYPNVKDLQVQLKRSYQDARAKKDVRLVGGDKWFSLQAYRALNQAVGRCIRHRTDYGAIILCDPRFASKRETTSNLSRWVRSIVRHCGTAEASVPLLASFFSQHSSQQPQLHSTLPEAVVTPPTPMHQLTIDSKIENVNGGNIGETSPINRPQTLHSLQDLVRNPVSQVDSQVGQIVEDSMMPDAAINSSHQAGLFFNGEGGDSACILINSTGLELEKMTQDRMVCKRQLQGFQFPTTLTSILNHNFGDTQGMEKFLDNMDFIAIPQDLEKGIDVFELPQGCKLGRKVIIGKGRWVPQDGLVYAPLVCWIHCSVRIFGMTVLAAGPGSSSLVGRNWFLQQNGMALKGISGEDFPRMPKLLCHLGSISCFDQVL
ncbi:unnamed protein product [Choristocarpus tenellus]